MAVPIEIKIANLSKKNIVIENVSAEIIMFPNDTKGGIASGHDINLLANNYLNQKIYDKLLLGLNDIPINIDPEKYIKCYGFLKIRYILSNMNMELIKIFKDKKGLSSVEAYKGWNPSLNRLAFLSSIEHAKTNTKYSILSENFCKYEITIDIITSDKHIKKMKLGPLCSISHPKLEKSITSKSIELNDIMVTDEELQCNKILSLK